MLRCARVLGVSRSLWGPWLQPVRASHSRANGKWQHRKPSWFREKEIPVDPAVLEAEIRGKLETEQEQVLDLVLAGHNVFLTGNFVSAVILFLRFPQDGPLAGRGMMPRSEL